VTPLPWIEETSGEDVVLKPAGLPRDLVVAFSGRGVAPEGTASATAHLSRRFARALGLPDVPIVRATQVHGTVSVLVRERPAAGTVFDAGKCDILLTAMPGVALAVQTADCVPIILAGPGALALAHAGWRGSAKNAAGVAVEELSRLGVSPSRVRAWLGPSIRQCCYEVGGEVAALFPGEFTRRSRGSRYALDLPAVNRAQLAVAGVPAEGISAHPTCTHCGGERFASYRRDGIAAGRMIALALIRTAAETI